MTARQLEQGLQAGELISDRRLSDYLLLLEDAGSLPATQDGAVAAG